MPFGVAMRQAIFLTSLTLLVQLLPVTGFAASADSRACNQQGREIALRISEEVRGSLDTAERNKIAAIAEEVCLDFATPAVQSNRPVIGRPAPAQQANVAAAVAAAPETKVESESDEANDADEEGLLGNIRIIPAEERVRRPGLKRK